MAGSSLYIGERSGARIFRLNRVGYDSAGADLGSHVYTATFRSERIAPAGLGALVLFRGVTINLYSSGTYSITVKVYVDDVQTKLGDNTAQTIVLASAVAREGKYSPEAAIEAVGRTIQVEVTVTSSAVTAPFMIESIIATGRVIRGAASRRGETT